MPDKSELIYLASPYNHVDESVRIERFHKVCKVAGILIQRGLLVFSPIAHSHPIASVVELGTGWFYWKTFDLRMLSMCDRLFVVKMDGWDHSVGVQAEMAEANKMGIPIEFIDENGVVG